MAMKFWTLIGAALLAAPAAATTITFAGTIVDSGATWRTASVDKAGLDLGGTDVIGLDGWYLAGPTQLASRAASASASATSRVSLPDYVTGASVLSAVYGGNSDYQRIDNPLTTPGAGGSQLITAAFAPAPGAHGVADILSFTLGGKLPDLIRIGILVDALDAGRFNAEALGIFASSGGGSGLVSIGGTGFANNRPDWLFFDISDFTDGETLTVRGRASASNYAVIGGVSFDSYTDFGAGAVPEPATWALMIGGFGAAGGALRRRRYAAAR